MKKTITLLLVGILASQLTACDTHRAGQCENIAITNTAIKEENKSDVNKEKINEIVNFIDKEKGAMILAKEDDYIKSLSKFDYASKFKSNKSLDEDERYTFYKEATLDWSDDEKIKLSKAVDYLLKKTEKLNLNKPPKINFIKTSGYEEGGAAYTRDEYIILTERDLERLNEEEMNAIVAHEFFHMYSRYNKEIKADFYEVINFKETKELVFPKEIRELRISNPDAPITNYYIECDYNGETYKFMPIIYASQKFDSEYSDIFFDYLREPLLAIEIKDGHPIPLYVDGEPFIVEKRETDNFYKKTGENTYYALHPEEIMADNFALYVIDGKVNSQWVIDGMLEIMKNNQAK